MIDLIIIIVLIAGILTGVGRGVLYQLVNLVGLVAAIIAALIGYKSLAEKFVMYVPYPTVTDDTALKFGMDGADLMQTFYNVLAFVLIFFIVKFVFKIIASLFNFVQYVPVLGGFNRLLGGLLGFIQVYFMLFFLLYILALLPIESIQNFIDSSILTNLILKYTPLISTMFQQLWFVYTK